MNNKNKDLNLLRIFEIIMTERNVSRAAQRLAMSQPALSNALARLRRDFGDELFVRSGKGMAPTPRALALKDEVSAVLARAGALYENSVFSPQTIDGLFRIATNDYFEHLLLARLLPYLGKHAPRLTTVIRPTGGSFPKAALESGALDLAIAGFFGDLPEGFYQRTLLEESFACVVRKGHPRVKEKLSLETFLELDHILVSLQGDLVGFVDRALAAKSQKRRVVAGVANFHTAGAIVAASDYIVTVPSRTAEAYARQHPVLCFPPPLPVPGFKLVQVWHERTHKSAPHVWLRQSIGKVLDGA